MMAPIPADPVAEPSDLEVEADIPPVEVPEAFAVRDAHTANWVVRKIVESRSYADRVKAWAEGELRRAQREERWLIRRFGPELEDWVRPQLQGQRRQSVKLPGGMIGYRKEPARLDILDEPKLLGWCRQWLPDAVQTLVRIRKATVRKHVLKTGDVPDGANVSGGQQRFYIR